ncbi:MAG: MlaE family ABC transporter permease [Planctomycetota bacterium]|jgi:phospholipid/cholesterol/gamma-HCH transport system permease protein
MKRSDRGGSATKKKWFWRALGRLGKAVIDLFELVVYLTSFICTVVVLAIRPRRWHRTIRRVFAYQILHMGVFTIIPVGLVAMLVGVLVVMQAQLWLGMVGQTGWLGPLLVVVVVRELAPLLTNLIIILRSGSEMTTELATMTVTGRVRMLDSQGIDPLIYLVMPRMIAIVISAFCLTLLFIVFSFVSGYLFSSILGLRMLPPSLFLDHVLRAFQSEDVLNLLFNSLIPPLLTGAICCLEGLTVPQASTAVPVATRRALSRSVVCLFLVSVPASVLTYL